MTLGEHRKLDVFIGKWINAGRTVARPGVPSAEILTSDIYEWAPGGFFLIHTAYGTIAGERRNSRGWLGDW